MIAQRFRSLQLRLAVRLASLFLIGTAVIFGILIYRAYDTADTLNDRELSLRAADLGQHVVANTDGTARLDLPPNLAAAYEAASGADIFAIRGPNGRVIGALPADFGQIVEHWPEPSDDPSYFHLNSLGSLSRDYFGLGISVDNPAGPLSIWVARATGADALVDSLLRDFVLDIAWAIPIFVLLTLAIGILAIRSAIKPIREVSEIASSIGPGSTSVRLPEKDLPTEIMPLVVAVNRALTRLEQGFAVQRQFTANAAHELRTPLAIVTGALDTMDGGTELIKLKADVARMNRLVEQLLSVARLDAIALDVSETVDLNGVGQNSVASLAPWALAHKRTIAFAGTDKPIWVKGNTNAIEDAIRNLVENAIIHSPEASEITVSVLGGGVVEVEDQGPGIPAEDREKIFERFWRGKSTASHGAGLGLSIVREIMKSHGGGVRVENRAGGGSRFTLFFSLAGTTPPTVSMDRHSRA
jgi:two-component system, OmpR family, sensor histidine kinase TctE